MLAALERLLVASTRTAVILEYADTIAPAGDPAFQGDGDRAAVVTLHRWSFLPEIETRRQRRAARHREPRGALAEARVEPEDRGRRGPDARPRDAARGGDSSPTRQAAGRATPTATPTLTAGLKAVQIAAILAPPPAAEEDRAAREAFILGILGGARTRRSAPQKLAALTAGMSRDEVLKLIAPGATAPDPGAAPADRARREADRLIARRKREILERECFGLVEFVEPQHGFEVVGGMEEVKKDLLVLAENIREGRTQPRADGHPVHRPDGHRQDVRRRGVREGVRPHDRQAEELPLEVGGRDRRATSRRS